MRHRLASAARTAVAALAVATSLACGAGAASAAGAPPQHSKPLETRITDSRPRHLAPGLCHLLRTRQVHARGAKADEGWSDEGEPEVRIWLDGGPIPCTAPQQSARLNEALPAPDVISLLQQQSALLDRARLLFVGNTGCARQRAYHFTLAAVASAPPEKGALAMYTLTYESDRNTAARVTIRKSRSEFAAWNVSCSS